jgi:hypothetical protein
MLCTQATGSLTLTLFTRMVTRYSANLGQYASQFRLIADQPTYTRGFAGGAINMLSVAHVHTFSIARISRADSAL